MISAPAEAGTRGTDDSVARRAVATAPSSRSAAQVDSVAGLVRVSGPHVEYPVAFVQLGGERERQAQAPKNVELVHQLPSGSTRAAAFHACSARVQGTRGVS